MNATIRTAAGHPATTHVLMVTDMSGSMTAVADDVRTGFNEYLTELRSSDAEFRVSVTLFDTVLIPLCTAARLVDVPRLTGRNYAPRGMTALYDAMGRTMAEFDTARPELGPDERVLMVIQTDGVENSSTRYTAARIRRMIAAREATGQWAFLYLGAGAAAWREGQNLGLRPDQLIRTGTTAADTRSAYRGLSVAATAYSRGASGAQTTAIVATHTGDN